MLNDPYTDHLLHTGEATNFTLMGPGGIRGEETWIVRRFRPYKNMLEGTKEECEAELARLRAMEQELRED